MQARNSSLGFFRLVIALCFVSFSVFSQETTLKISSLFPTPPEFLNLLKPLNEIRENTILNESIVDLATVYLTDSILTKKVERHRLPVIGGFTRMVGIRWLTINWRKEKYVGTAQNGFRIPGGEHFTEHDININLVPHLKRSIDLAYHAYQRQKEIGREKKKRDYNAVPYIYPDSSTNLNFYHLHCELTPPGNFRAMINDLFYPILPGNSATKHPHFGDEHFTVGLYGAYISDCNHSCHPEIHPYEWMWWLNVHPNLDKEENSRTWLAGMIVRAATGCRTGRHRLETGRSPSRLSSQRIKKHFKLS